MKYSQWIGLLALALLILSCFLPWTYYPDIQKTFTGFFSENNLYGKPGKALVILAVLSGVCFIVPRVWAKRIHFFLSAVIVAYAFRSFIIFASCYRGICPEKKVGLWLMLITAFVAMIMAFMPKMPVKTKVES